MPSTQARAAPRPDGRWRPAPSSRPAAAAARPAPLAPRTRLCPRSAPAAAAAEVDFVLPPAGVPNGERVSFAGYAGPVRARRFSYPCPTPRVASPPVCRPLTRRRRSASAPSSLPWVQPDERLDSKKKQLEAVFPFLATDGDGVAKYKDVPFTTSKGVCTARLKNCHIK